MKVVKVKVKPINQGKCKSNLNIIILVVSIFSNLLTYGIYGVDPLIGTFFNYIIFIMIIIFMLLNYKEIIGRMKKERFLQASLLFFIMNLITILYNEQIIMNLKIFILTIAQVIVIAQFCKYDEKTIKFILNSIVFVILIITIISAILYFMNINVSLYPNRYCGIYANPNIASALAAVALAFSLVMLFMYEKWNARLYYIINIILQIIMMRLCDSRAGMIFSISFIFLFFFILLFIMKKKIILSILVSTTITVMFFCFYDYSSVMMTQIKTQMYTTKDSIEETVVTPSESSTQNETKPNTPNPSILVDNIGRDSNLEVQSTNYRLLLIENGIKTGLDKPVFGHGIFNVATAINDKSDVYLDGLFGGGTHNNYVEVFVSNGFVGLSFFLIILLMIFMKIIKKVIYIYKKKNSFSFEVLSTAMFAALFIAFSIYGLFEANIILSSSIMAALFWMINGVNLYEEK